MGCAVLHSDSDLSSIVYFCVYQSTMDGWHPIILPLSSGVLALLNKATSANKKAVSDDSSINDDADDDQ